MLARLARDLDLDTLTVEQYDRVLVVRFCDPPVHKFGATRVAAGSVVRGRLSAVARFVAKRAIGAVNRQGSRRPIKLPQTSLGSTRLPASNRPRFPS